MSKDAQTPGNRLYLGLWWYHRDGWDDYGDLPAYLIRSWEETAAEFLAGGGPVVEAARWVVATTEPDRAGGVWTVRPGFGAALRDLRDALDACPTRGAGDGEDGGG